MPVYMHQFKYKDEGIRMLLKEEKPVDREAFLRVAVEAFGGTLQSFYFCFGEYDGLVVSSFPDETSAFACVTAIFAQGRVQTVRTTQLIASADGMKAFGMVRERINP